MRLQRPAALSGLITGVAFVGGIVGAAKLAETRIPMPGAPADDIRRYYADSGRAVRFSVAGQALSILTLLQFTRDVAGLAERAEPTSRWLPAAVRAGSIGSAACLAVSAATAASLAADPGVDDETIRRRAAQVFVAGGPVHAVPYAGFVAALGLAGRRAGLWDRGAVATAVVSALSSLLSPAYFKWESAGWLIPIGRFSGYVLSGVAGVRIARGRR